MSFSWVSQWTESQTYTADKMTTAWTTQPGVILPRTLIMSSDLCFHGERLLRWLQLLSPPEQVGSCLVLVTGGKKENSERQKENQLLWQYNQYCYGNWSTRARFVSDRAVIVSPKGAYGNMWCSYELICQALCPSWHHRPLSNGN